jgi:hypothetical protein
MLSSLHTPTRPYIVRPAKHFPSLKNLNVFALDTYAMLDVAASRILEPGFLARLAGKGSCSSQTRKHKID